MSAGDLFNAIAPSAQPLADRMRPGELDGFAGQAHLLGPGKPLRLTIEAGRMHSMIFWGPPGTGKTPIEVACESTRAPHTRKTSHNATPC